MASADVSEFLVLFGANCYAFGLQAFFVVKFAAYVIFWLVFDGIGTLRRLRVLVGLSIVSVNELS